MTSPRSFFDPDSPETRAEWVFAPPSEFGSPARNQSSHHRTETKPFPPIRHPRALTTTLSLLGVSQCCKRVWFSLKDPSVCSPLYIPRTRLWVKDYSCTCNIPNYNHRTDCCSHWRVSIRERDTHTHTDRERESVIRGRPRKRHNMSLPTTIWGTVSLSH